MASHFQKVKDFQRRFQLPVGSTPQALPLEMNNTAQLALIMHLRLAEKVAKLKRGDADQVWGRVQMMIEELREYCEAVMSGDLPAQADSLVDLEYFALGTAVMQGFPHDAIFDAVHTANMQKELVVDVTESRRLNKLDVKKPDGWTPPDVAGILEAAAADGSFSGK